MLDLLSFLYNSEFVFNSIILFCIAVIFGGLPWTILWSSARGVPKNPMMFIVLLSGFIYSLMIFAVDPMFTDTFSSLSRLPADFRRVTSEQVQDPIP